jgi:hypothetical protein
MALKQRPLPAGAIPPAAAATLHRCRAANASGRPAHRRLKTKAARGGPWQGNGIRPNRGSNRRHLCQSRWDHSIGVGDGARPPGGPWRLRCSGSARPVRLRRLALPAFQPRRFQPPPPSHWLPLLFRPASQPSGVLRPRPFPRPSHPSPPRQPPPPPRAAPAGAADRWAGAPPIAPSS